MMDFRDNGMCFACGEKNPRGLKLRFRLNEAAGEAEEEIVFPDDLQGWDGVVHGGLLATVLDEAMIYAAGAKHIKSITGEITVRYLEPARTSVGYKVIGRVVEDKGRIILAESELVGPDGRPVARARGKLFKIKA